MPTTTNSDSRKSADQAATIADPAALHEILDEVFAEMPHREEPITSTPPLVVKQSMPIAPRPTEIAYQPQPQTRVSADDDGDWSYYLKQAICGGLVLLGVALFYGGMPAAWQAAINPFAHSTVANATPALHSASETKPIEEIRVGDRFVGRNPIREQADLVEPDPATWRTISLHLTKESGLGLKIELLRPLAWIEEQSVKPGSTIYLDLQEMGAVGDAAVIDIGPCPHIQPGAGAVVTGTFKHEADDQTKVVHLRLEDQLELTGVTANHPYWSEDRQEFVEAGNLRAGELVDTAYGLKHVVAITPIAHHGFLYNLETTEHVYRVGSLGTLVHNSCVIHGKPQHTSPAHAKAMTDMADRMAKSGAYTNVYMHSKWTTILQGKGVSVSPNQLPDVAGIRLDGKIDIIEFASSARDYKYGNLLGRNRDIWNQLPQHLRGDILVYNELGNWTQVFP